MDFLGKPCPVCARTFRDDDDVVVCPKCGAPYHRECYLQKGKCIYTDDLHRNHQTWQDLQNATDNDTTNDQAENGLVCPRCKTVNPDHAIVCKNCGSFLSNGIGMSQEDNTYNRADSAATDSNPFGKDNPFSVFMDPMGGVPQDEDFDGVTGAELAKFVKNNTTYYLPVFQGYKNKKRCRFNFCAFLFVGGWYLYRKQYLKGALLSLLYLAVELGALFCSIVFTTPFIKEANQFYSGANYIGFSDYFSWAVHYKSFGDLVLMFLPYLLYAVFLLVRIICGFRGNKSYYHFAVSKIKGIKAGGSNNNEPSTSLAEAGGVNTAVAWVCLICYLILSFAPFFIK